MNLLKTIAIFAVLYVGATILLRVVFDKLYRNIQKALSNKRKKALGRRYRAKRQKENLNGFRQTVCYQQLQLVLQAYNDQIHHTLV